MWHRLKSFLSRSPGEHSLSVLLVFLCLELFAFGPVARVQGHMLFTINGIVFSVLLVVGVLAMTTHPKVQIVSAVVVLLALATRWADILHNSPHLLLWSIIFTLLATLIFLTIILRQVYGEGPVSGHKILGSIAAYLLFALFFSCAYSIVEFMYQGAFTFPGHMHPTRQFPLEVFLYFSISTLTTVGFGDITAVHPLARSLVMLEAVIGSLYPPILIGILVSLHTRARRDDDRR